MDYDTTQTVTQILDYHFKNYDFFTITRKSVTIIDKQHIFSPF